MIRMQQRVVRKWSKKLLNMLLIGGVSVLVFSSCQEKDSNTLTSPNILASASEGSNPWSGFYVSKGDGQFSAKVEKSGEFQVSVPDGEFLLTYTTIEGTFQVVFRASEAATVHIGLPAHVSVSDVIVQPGHITETSGSTLHDQGVTLFAWPNSSVPCEHLFQPSLANPTVLVDDGHVVIECSVPTIVPPVITPPEIPTSEPPIIVPPVSPTVVPTPVVTPEIVPPVSPTAVPTPVVTPVIPTVTPATCKDGPNLWPVQGTINGWSCWYLSPDGESCTTTCAPYNGYNQAIGITNLDLTINGEHYHQMCACNG